VLGAGSWGTALAVHLAHLGRPVRLWARDPGLVREMQARRANAVYLPGVTFPAGLEATGALADALQDADAIISAIPSHGVADVWRTAAALVAPGHERALPLEPGFIAPQDGAEKQDCEARAMHRWLATHGAKYARLKPIYLGDDLSSRQPTCEAVLAAGGHFLFTAKPSSHKTLYSWLDGAEVPTLQLKVKQGARFVTHRYRWLESVPIRDGKDAMLVNWLEIEIVDPAGKTTYRNGFVTDLPVTAANVAELAACARARWKIENESFNTLKTKGYNLEHNFGHGRKHLAAVLATMNLLAFAMHTAADLVDAPWKAARAAVGARKRFFEDLRAITTYLVFPTWAALVETLRAGQPPPAIRDG